jgi:hypothetical protein
MVRLLSTPVASIEKIAVQIAFDILSQNKYNL